MRDAPDVAAGTVAHPVGVGSVPRTTGFADADVEAGAVAWRGEVRA